MGTRSTVGLVIDGERKVYYNQFDGYFDGVGQEVVDNILRINAEKGWEKFKANARAAKLVTTKDKATPEEVQYYADKRLIDHGVDGPHPDGTPSWYQLVRNAQGGEGIELLYNGTLKHILDGDGQQEYEYILNLDTMEFTFTRFYSHFTKTLPLEVEIEEGVNPDFMTLKEELLRLVNEEEFDEAEEVLQKMKTTSPNKLPEVYNEWWKGGEEDEEDE